MLGYTVGLVLHVTNIYNMIAFYKGDVLNDPEVKRFHDNQFRFLTIWNVYMQVIYMALGLSCDVLTLTNQGKDSSLLKSLKTIRDPLFTNIVMPFSITVSLTFWTIYTYDGALILPPSVDKTITTTSNHIMHTYIAPLVLWEILFRPRKRPETHLGNLLMINLYAAFYLVVIIVGYLEQGLWVYPIMDQLHGTIYFYGVVGVPLITTNVAYILQWYLTDLIWKGDGNRKKVL
ncbi:androgen-dependent TFPI-regulating protein-like [Spodoptera frugiperda]|uniref:Androgen-dependent TFPI-regulating protein-like n=1 Tax=Spodoptera frugiperda TaxID=7108 RepID=A0A9R0E358_SPOFR|nr:androgen-dependent TFPI-regulating protein-like [Spodoptera frugiperda]